MASNYTTNYGLCQWEPEDDFIREEFNADNAKIDAALKAAEEKAAADVAAAERAAKQTAASALTAAETRLTQADSALSTRITTAQSAADRALADLEPLNYNVYNLLLQNYYEGLHTGYKKALRFDGFGSDSGISSLSGVVWDGPNKSLLLDAVGQQQDSYGFGHIHYFTSTGSRLNWTATGNGTLTKAELYMSGDATLTVSQGDTTLATAAITVTGSGNTSLGTASFSVPVTAGVTYTFFLAATDEPVYIRTNASDSTLPLRLSFTPRTATSGTLATTGADMGTGDKLLVWARHLNGTAALSVRQDSGSWTAMTKTATRTTVNLDGVSCTESAFSLDRSFSGSLSFQLDLSTTAGASVRVYDYGAVLI